jgi:uncharacterized protein (TIGR02996 family)
MTLFPCARFRRRTVLEVGPVEALLSADQRREREAARRQPSPDGPATAVMRPPPHGRPPPPRGPRWFGCAAGQAIGFAGRWGDVIEFADATACHVPPGAAEFLHARSAGRLTEPTPLTDAPLTAAVVDPLRCLFRHPDEAGFWDRVAADSFDATARLVYADWLDDHDDPHAWVFREPAPFVYAGQRLDWTGAMGRVLTGAPERRGSVWEFARLTGRGSRVPFALSDGAAVPQFVAYLLGVTSVRAVDRLSDRDRWALAHQTAALGLSLMADVILGRDDLPVCRVTDPTRTVYVLGELIGRAATPAEIADKLRAANPPPDGPRA